MFKVGFKVAKHHKCLLNSIKNQTFVKPHNFSACFIFSFVLDTNHGVVPSSFIGLVCAAMAMVLFFH
jgi:hypothetical protein